MQRLNPRSLSAHWTDIEKVPLPTELTIPYAVDPAYRGAPLSPVAERKAPVNVLLLAGRKRKPHIPRPTWS